MTLTLRSVRKELMIYKVRIRKTVDGEYRVSVKGQGEDSAYYTNDLYDALQTGKDMAARAGTNPRPADTATEPAEFRCICPRFDNLDLHAQTGPHHNDGCIYHELPDYSVFQPDE